MARRPTEPTANPARGAALVVVAVVIGLVLLRNGLDTSETVVPSSDGGSSTDAGTGTDEGTDEGSDEGDAGVDSTLPERTPAEVRAIVLNGSGVQGAAGRYSDALDALGYTLTNPDGANATNNAAATLVLYAPGFEREAVTVAAAIGAPPTVTPTPLGTTQPGVTNGADVVVVLGSDLGNQNPPGT